VNQCGLCEEPIATGYLCERDTVTLAKRLKELPALDAEMVECLVPRRSGPAEFVTAGSAGPRSPLDEEVLDLMQSNHIGEVVHLWRVDVQRERWPQHTPPPPSGLAADCRWLGMELAWIAVEYPAAGDLAREVRELEVGMRSIVGDPAPRPQRLGLCVAVDGEGVVCGAAIKRMPGQTRVQCRWCGYIYATGQDWMRLQYFQPRESA
jgi:hypothetical protein